MFKKRILWITKGEIRDGAVHGLGGQWPPLDFKKKS